MQAIGFTGRLARASARRPWLTIGMWGLVLVGAFSLAGSVNDHVSTTPTDYVATDSQTASDLDANARPAHSDATFHETIVVASTTSRMGDSAFDEAVARAVAAASAVDGVVSVATPTVGSPAVSNSGFAALIAVETAPSLDVVRGVLDAVNGIDARGVSLYLTGSEAWEIQFGDLAADQLARGETFGVLAALVILVVVFGAFAAAGLPLGVALVSVITTTGLIAALARVADVYTGALTISGMLGLALGIDYSLVAVQRFREELASGRSVIDAVTITGGTANRAVLLSGVTVVISMGAMFLIPTSNTFAAGIGAGLVAIVSVSAALTLLPAVLRLLGRRVNRGRVPTAHPGQVSAAWTRIAKGVIARPAASATLGLAILLALAAPVFSLRLANAGPDAMPDDFPVRHANEVLRPRVRIRRVQHGRRRHGRDRSRPRDRGAGPRDRRRGRVVGRDSRHARRRRVRRRARPLPLRRSRGRTARSNACGRRSCRARSPARPHGRTSGATRPRRSTRSTSSPAEWEGSSPPCSA